MKRSKLKRRLEKLSLQPGDVILFRGQFRQEEADCVQAVLAQMAIPGLSVILLGPETSVERLDESAMARIGWVRSMPRGATLQ